MVDLFKTKPNQTNRDDGVRTFPKSISPNVNVITLLKFDLTY